MAFDYLTAYAVTCMSFRQLFKFYRYAFAWENYLLLARVLQAAFLVRRKFSDQSITPKLKHVLPVIDTFFLPPQLNWCISDAKKIAWFANVVINFPWRWGRCLQRSLIVYRLLNGYGISARLYVGFDPGNVAAEGHVWVSNLSAGEKAFAESFDPLEKYTVIYISPLPVLNHAQDNAL